MCWPKQGTFLALYNFNPWLHSVSIATFVTVVQVLFRSLTNSLCVVLGSFLTVLKIICTPRGEILHGAPHQGSLSVILYVCMCNIYSNSWSFLIKLLADCRLAHPSLVQVYNLVTGVLKTALWSWPWWCGCSLTVWGCAHVAFKQITSSNRCI